MSTDIVVLFVRGSAILSAEIIPRNGPSLRENFIDYVHIKISKDYGGRYIGKYSDAQSLLKVGPGYYATVSKDDRITIYTVNVSMRIGYIYTAAVSEVIEVGYYTYTKTRDESDYKKLQSELDAAYALIHHYELLVDKLVGEKIETVNNNV